MRTSIYGQTDDGALHLMGSVEVESSDEAAAAVPGLLRHLANEVAEVYAAAAAPWDEPL